MDKKLQRSDNKMIAGVCAGLAEFFNIDPTIVRVLWAILAFAFGTGFLLYLICWLVMPRRWM